MEWIIDCLIDAGLDTLKLIPFLFITYLAMEALEQRTENASSRLIQHRNTGALGPLFGSLLGIVPQCGFSAAASSLYSGGLISIGTLLAVFLSTSDEMLPLLISSQVPLSSMAKILAAKALIGLISGSAVDMVLRRLRGHGRMRPISHAAASQSHPHPGHSHVDVPAENMPVQLSAKHIHDLCEDENCGCEDGGRFSDILRAACIHTIHIIIFVLLITFLLNLMVEGLGEEAVSGLLTGRPLLGIFLTAAVGLIPNCASSILITQFYLDGLIAAGQMMSGLLVGAGAGLLVLFRTNQRHPRESAAIAGLLYALGVIWGFLITAAGITF